MSSFSAASQSHSSEFVSHHIAKSMVFSDSGLSLLDHPLDRQNRDIILSLLTDLSFEIVAVWVVARPLSGLRNTTYEHWCVKIQAPPAVLSMDWLESKKKGAFGLQQTTASEAELDDFLHYYVHNENGSKRKKKWQIISSVTPSPLKNTSYFNFIDDYQAHKLKAFMKQNYKNPNYTQILQHININKKVCDIADFICMWTEERWRNGEKRAVSYNPIVKNCQQFAVDLFGYLVAYKYPEKVQLVKNALQSPYDRRKYKSEEKANSKSKGDKDGKYIKHKWHDFTLDYIANELASYCDANDDQKYEVEEDEKRKDINIDIELISDMLITEQSYLQIVILKSKHLNSAQLQNQLKSALYCSAVLCGYYMYIIPLQTYAKWTEFSIRTKMNDIITEYGHQLETKDDGNIEQIQRIDIRSHNKVIPFNLVGKACYGLALNGIRNNENILLLFESNNARFAMVTHLDYSINCMCDQTKKASLNSNIEYNNFNREEKKEERYKEIKECNKNYCWYSSKLIKYMRLYEQNPNILDNNEFRVSTHGLVLQCYHHCRIYHNDLPSNDCQIRNVNNHHCTYYLRNYRNRNAEKRQERDFYERVKLRDSRDAARLQILDSIHCYLFHASQINDENKSKFMNDFENYENDAKANEKNRFHFGLPRASHYSHTSILRTRDTDNLIEHENMFILNRNNKQKQIVDNFGFGVDLSYWNEWNAKKKAANLVKPKYETLKTELTKNKIYKLSDEQYYDTYNKAQLWNKEIKIKAKNVGRTNKRFNIRPGDALTVNHIISLMVYCNYTELQYRFKQHCRPYDNEKMESFLQRNSEIAHWCRYLFECGSIYGDKMNGNDTLYTGLTSKLLFSSWNTRFYCPLSTTPQLMVAQSFCKTNNGIIIKLQRADETTMNFDVSYLSDYPEDERLIVGQSLKIMDIILLENINLNNDNMSLSKWILALHLFEKIVNGLFVVWDKELMNKPVHKNLSLLIEHHLLPNDKQKAVHYIQQIFNNMIKAKLIANDGKPWLNLFELKKLYKKNKKLATYFYDIKQQKFGPLFVKHKYNNEEQVRWVKQFRWKIEGNKFIQLKTTTNKWIYSKELYVNENGDNRKKISFYFGCRAMYVSGIKQCELYIFIKSKSVNCESIKEISIGYDRLCVEYDYHSYMHSEWIKFNLKHNVASHGGKTFGLNAMQLNKLSSITWTVGIKIIGIIFNANQSIV